MTNNRWKDISRGSRRRAVMKHNIYWVKEELIGDYGICIEVPINEEIKLDDIDLKDIDIIKSLNEGEKKFEWYLILRNKEEWQIFQVLCEDLITEASKADDEKAMLAITEIRLKRWQNLLKKKVSNNLTMEVQMGLFGELSCLQNIIAPFYNSSEAVRNWVGPEHDKQDFLLADMAIEVKSYRTSKGDIVTISSKEQLDSSKEYLYLVSYALTIGKEGKNIASLVKEIKSNLKQLGDYSTMDLLDLKLLNYGYSPIIHKEDQLFNFIVDKTNIFEVNDSFPKLTSRDITKEIVSVKYQIDLSRCLDYEVQLLNISGGVKNIDDN